MSIDALNNLKQAILTAVERHGIESARARFLDPLPALSVERRQILRLFGELEQDQAGNWNFRAA